MKNAIAWEHWEADLERVRSGSLDLDAFIRRNRDSIDRVACSIRWAAGFELEEASQVVRLAIWYAVASFDALKGESIAGWVRCTITRRLKEYARVALRDQREYGQYIEDSDVVDAGRTPDEIVGALNVYRDRVLGRMDGDSGAVLNAVFIEGRTPQEIYEAGILPGLSYAWTRCRVYAVVRMATALATEF